MTATQSLIVGTILIAAAALGLAGLAWLVLGYRRKLSRARPEWARMLTETPYFRQSLTHIFKAHGYEIIHWWEFRDPLERQVREVVFALRRRGHVYAALCGRWVIPITSKVISRFEQALAATGPRRADCHDKLVQRGRPPAGARSAGGAARWSTPPGMDRRTVRLGHSAERGGKLSCSD